MFPIRLCLLLLPSACVCLVALRNEMSTVSVPAKERNSLDREHPSVDETTTTPSPTPIEDDPNNSLAEALRVLRRRKREVTGSHHRPYSAYRPLGTHRYRYPLYRKRSVYLPPDYAEGDEPYLNEMDSIYDDYGMQDADKKSLFRERERGPTPKLISNAHFSNKPILNKRTLSSYRPSYYQKAPNPEDSPYDLNALRRLYEQGKKVRATPIGSRNMDSLSGPWLRVLNEVDPEEFQHHYFPEEMHERAYSNLLKNAMEEYEKYGALDNGMTRRKRSSPMPMAIHKMPISSDSTTNKTHENHQEISSKGGSHQDKQSDRQKRAYNTAPIFLDPKQEVENDFLTREYFKTIARSVDNKRKRMAFAKFEKQKRSRLDAFLENPKTLRFVQNKIKEAEEEVAKEAQAELEEGDPDGEGVEDDLTSQALLSNSIARLDALERMREALYQLEHLQEQEVIQKRAQSLVGGMGDIEESEKAKRRKALKAKLIREGQKEEEQERQKRKEATLRNLLNGNRRDECPVLERIVENCLAVTEMVTDDDLVFLEPCLRHEVCYMCGSGLDVSQHECDALFSAGLEAGCNDASSSDVSNGSLDCLGAAGTTYNLLGDPSRYDNKGTCTYDPCVRKLLDSR